MSRINTKHLHVLSQIVPLICGLLLSTTMTHAEELQLEPGDIIEFSVAGAPDLAKKVPIGMDGLASFPLVGEVAVKGRTLTQLRADVRSILSQTEYRQHVAASAKSSLDIIWANQVTITITEYRPIYLNGDVAKPGEQKFKPGLTIRQALSLAGGYDILRFRMDNPFIDAADLRGSYASAWIDYAKEQVRLQRLEAELNLNQDTDSTRMSEPVISSKLLGKIRQAEQAYKSADDESHAKERSHLQSLVIKTDGDVQSMTKLRDTEMANTSFDEAEYKRIHDLYQNGTLPMVRVAEARRIELLSATQSLQSQVELERAVKDREILSRKLVTLDANRNMMLLDAQQASQVKLAAIKTKIDAIADKMLYVGALKTQLTRGTGGQPDLMLFRRGKPGRKVEEDLALEPGDVVEVALKVESTEPVVR